jgi:myo-inositol-1-phosphate synthase
VNEATIRTAIVGTGNCASSFVQGIAHYKDVDANEVIPGLMKPRIGSYAPRDIEISAAFDVDERKVGYDVAEAIFAEPNNTLKFAQVKQTGIVVRRGPTLDSLGTTLRGVVRESREKPDDVADTLRQTRTDVVVSYLPVGSQQASEYYAEAAMAAGCGYVNCIPVFLASDAKWRKKFEAANCPIIGDDIKSQVGATIIHRALVSLFSDRGVRVDRTYQLNFGGNTDFQNMLDRDRLVSKKISKTNSVNSQIASPLSAKEIHIGPSDHVPWLEDRKIAYIRVEGTGFGGSPISAELKLEVWDSPNSAGVVIDAVRCAKLALDRGIGGAIVGPSSYFMKSPPQQFTDDEANRQTQRFIQGVD